MHPPFEALCDELCENEKFRQTVNTIGPGLAGAIATAVAGPPAGAVVKGGCTALRAADERTCAQLLTRVGIGTAFDAATPLLLAGLGLFLLADAIFGDPG